MLNLSLMNHPNLVVVHYNPYAGGKFWINCLSHSRHAVPGLCVAGPQYTHDFWLLDDLGPEEIQQRKIARINSTLLPAERMHEWCRDELGCGQFWGCNLYELLHTKATVATTAIQCLDQYKCFLVNHRPEDCFFEEVCSKLPQAQHILLKNADNFQRISLNKKQLDRNLVHTLAFDTTPSLDAFVVDVDNTYMNVDFTINCVKECLEYLGLDTELDPNIHSFVTRYFDLHQ
jgi:hypothetical protein